MQRGAARRCSGCKTDTPSAGQGLGRAAFLDGRTRTLAVNDRMRPPISDDRLFELALEAFRHPPQSYYEWVDEMLARRRAQAPGAPAKPVASDPSTPRRPSTRRSAGSRWTPAQYRRGSARPAQSSSVVSRPATSPLPKTASSSLTSRRRSQIRLPPIPTGRTPSPTRPRTPQPKRSRRTSSTCATQRWDELSGMPGWRRTLRRAAGRGARGGSHGRVAQLPVAASGRSGAAYGDRRESDYTGDSIRCSRHSSRSRGYSDSDTATHHAFCVTARR